MSRQLDFDVRINNQHPSRRPNAGPHIDVTDQKQATMAMRAEIVWLAEQWGYIRAPVVLYSMTWVFQSNRKGLGWWTG